MSEWSSAVDIQLDKVNGQTISVGGKTWPEAVCKREVALLLRRAKELLGIHSELGDYHTGPRIIHVVKGSRQSRKFS